jgi:hypothetical protein
MLEVTGKLFKILPVENGTSKSGKTWEKMTFILEVKKDENDKYPKKLAIDAWGEKLNQIRDTEIGSEITVAYDVSSTEYNGRWFTNATFIFLKNEVSKSNETKNISPPIDSDYMSEDEADDLPF